MNTNQYTIAIEMSIVGIIALVASTALIVLIRYCFNEYSRTLYSDKYESLIRFLFISLLAIIIMCTIFEIVWLSIYNNV